MIILGKYQKSSLPHNKQKYLDAYELSYSGKVTNKHSKSEYAPRVPKFIILNNEYELAINKEVYWKLNVGDSVSKLSNCDSVYYYDSKKELIIIEDQNKKLRERYFELLNEE